MIVYLGLKEWLVLNSMEGYTAALNSMGVADLAGLSLLEASDMASLGLTKGKERKRVLACLAKLREQLAPGADSSQSDTIQQTPEPQSPPRSRSKRYVANAPAVDPTTTSMEAGESTESEVVEKKGKREDSTPTRHAARPSSINPSAAVTLAKSEASVSEIGPSNASTLGGDELNEKVVPSAPHLFHTDETSRLDGTKEYGRSEEDTEIRSSNSVDRDHRHLIVNEPEPSDSALGGGANGGGGSRNKRSKRTLHATVSEGGFAIGGGAQTGAHSQSGPSAPGTAAAASNAQNLSSSLANLGTIPYNTTAASSTNASTGTNVRSGSKSYSSLPTGPSEKPSSSSAPSGNNETNTTSGAPSSTAMGSNGASGVAPAAASSSLHAVSPSISESSPSKHLEGQLQVKKGGFFRLTKKWEPRWCTFEGRIFQAFKSKDDKVPVFHVDITKAIVVGSNERNLKVLELTAHGKRSYWTGPTIDAWIKVMRSMSVTSLNAKRRTADYTGFPDAKAASATAGEHGKANSPQPQQLSSGIGLGIDSSGEVYQSLDVATEEEDRASELDELDLQVPVSISRNDRLSIGSRRAGSGRSKTRKPRKTVTVGVNSGNEPNTDDTNGAKGTNAENSAANASSSAISTAAPGATEDQSNTTANASNNASASPSYSASVTPEPTNTKEGKDSAEPISAAASLNSAASSSALPSPSPVHLGSASSASITTAGGANSSQNILSGSTGALGTGSGTNTAENTPVISKTRSKRHSGAFGGSTAEESSKFSSANNASAAAGTASSTSNVGSTSAVNNSNAANTGATGGTNATNANSSSTTKSNRRHHERPAPPKKTSSVGNLKPSSKLHDDIFEPSSRHYHHATHRRGMASQSRTVSFSKAGRAVFNDAGCKDAVVRYATLLKARRRAITSHALSPSAAANASASNPSLSANTGTANISSTASSTANPPHSPRGTSGGASSSTASIPPSSALSSTASSHTLSTYSFMDEESEFEDPYYEDDNLQVPQASAAGASGTSVTSDPMHKGIIASPAEMREIQGAGGNFPVHMKRPRLSASFQVVVPRSTSDKPRWAVRYCTFDGMWLRAYANANDAKLSSGNASSAVSSFDISHIKVTPIYISRVMCLDIHDEDMGRREFWRGVEVSVWLPHLERYAGRSYDPILGGLLVRQCHRDETQWVARYCTFNGHQFQSFRYQGDLHPIWTAHIRHLSPRSVKQSGSGDLLMELLLDGGAQSLWWEPAPALVAGVVKPLSSVKKFNFTVGSAATTSGGDTPTLASVLRGTSAAPLEVPENRRTTSHRGFGAVNRRIDESAGREDDEDEVEALQQPRLGDWIHVVREAHEIAVGDSERYIADEWEPDSDDEDLTNASTMSAASLTKRNSKIAPSGLMGALAASDFVNSVSMKGVLNYKLGNKSWEPRFVEVIGRYVHISKKKHDKKPEIQMKLTKSSKCAIKKSNDAKYPETLELHVEDALHVFKGKSIAQWHDTINNAISALATGSTSSHLIRELGSTPLSLAAIDPNELSAAESRSESAITSGRWGAHEESETDQDLNRSEDATRRDAEEMLPRSNSTSTTLTTQKESLHGTLGLAGSHHSSAHGSHHHAGHHSHHGHHNRDHQTSNNNISHHNIASGGGGGGGGGASAAHLDSLETHLDSSESRSSQHHHGRDRHHHNSNGGSGGGDASASHAAEEASENFSPPHATTIMMMMSPPKDGAKDSSKRKDSSIAMLNLGMALGSRGGSGDNTGGAEDSHSALSSALSASHLTKDGHLSSSSSSSSSRRSNPIADTRDDETDDSSYAPTPRKETTTGRKTSISRNGNRKTPEAAIESVKNSSSVDTMAQPASYYSDADDNQFAASTEGMPKPAWTGPIARYRKDAGDWSGRYVILRPGVDILVYLSKPTSIESVPPLATIDLANLASVTLSSVPNGNSSSAAASSFEHSLTLPVVEITVSKGKKHIWFTPEASSLASLIDSSRAKPSSQKKRGSKKSVAPSSPASPGPAKRLHKPHNFSNMSGSSPALEIPGKNAPAQDSKESPSTSAAAPVSGSSATPSKERERAEKEKDRAEKDKDRADKDKDRPEKEKEKSNKTPKA